MSSSRSTVQLRRGGIAISCLALALAYAGVTPAEAQSAAADTAAGQTPTITDQNTPATDAPGGKDAADIVVTGTLLRKVAPTGSETISVDQAAIVATQALTTDQLLGSIPQLGLNEAPVSNSGGTQLTVQRTSLRPLPANVGGSSPTLVLMDGHRLVGEGVAQSFPDPDVIPPSMIQRVDVLTDGGSSIYGADAVEGVVNFNTINSFDGLSANYRQGFGASFRTETASVTMGKTWDTGSVFVGYNYSAHGPIYGYDRSYIRNINYTTGLPGSVQCNPANVTISGVNYAVSGGNTLTQGNGNLCDASKLQAVYPEEHRHSVLAGFRQEITPSLTFDVKGYYSSRYVALDNGPLTSTATEKATTPGYISTGGTTAASTQTVGFSFAPVGGGEVATTKLWAYGVTPELVWKMGHDWQVRAYYNYGQSQTTENNPQYNPTLLSTDVALGTTAGINPYNIAASNAGALAQVLDYDQYGIGKDTMNNAKAVFDGPVFKLPGGDLRLAIGAEYLHESFSGSNVTDTYQNVLIAPLVTAKRNVESGFGEANIPLIGPANDIPLINAFTVAASVRYDHYSDFGGNTAPSVSAQWKVVNWVALRAKWNKNFQAPSLVQIANGGTPQGATYPAAVLNADPLIDKPGTPHTPGQIVVQAGGTALPLQPQTSRDMDFGFDINPPFIPGLGLHGTYYNLHYFGIISTPPLGSSATFYTNYPSSLYIINPTPAQIQTYLGNIGVSQTQITNILNQVATAQVACGCATGAYVVTDQRARNLGSTYIDGIDLSVDYKHNTGFGTVYGNFTSTRLLSITQAATVTSPFTSNQAGVQSHFTASTVVGATVGSSFLAQLTWRHHSGYTLATAAGLGQTKVSPFDTVDLFAQYDMKDRFHIPVSLSLGILNAFNESPPNYNGANIGQGAGYINGDPLGRQLQLGASMKF